MGQASTHTLSADAIAALAAGDPARLIALHRSTFGGFTMEDGGTGDGGTGGDGGEGGTGDGGEGGEDGTGGTGDGTGEDDGEGTDEDARVKRANRQAAQYRTQLRETQQQLQTLQDQVGQSNGVLDALRTALTGDGGEGEGETDPTEVARQATERVTSLESEVGSLRAQLLVHELAGDNGGNPNALLDSRRFTDTLGALDASADDYRDQVAEAIKSAVDSNSNLRAGQGSARGGHDGAGHAGGDGGTVTQEQFDAMDYKARTALFQTNPTLYHKLAG